PFPYIRSSSRSVLRSLTSSRRCALPRWPRQGIASTSATGESLICHSGPRPWTWGPRTTSDNGSPGSFILSHYHSPQPFESHPDNLSRSALRKHLRQQRRALSFEQQEQASERLALNLLKHPDLHRARHIGIYLANDGEIDPHLYIDLARRKGIHFYLPILHPIYPGKLVFSPYPVGIQLNPNRFGIPEPPFPKSKRRPAWALDAVLFPL